MGTENAFCELYPEAFHLICVTVPTQRATDVLAELIREGYLDD